MTTDQEKQLVERLVAMNEDAALELARRMLEEGASPLRVLKLCRLAADEVGRRFEAGDCFLSELVMAEDVLESVAGLAWPLIAEPALRRRSWAAG